MEGPHVFSIVEVACRLERDDCWRASLLQNPSSTWSLFLRYSCSRNLRLCKGDTEILPLRKMETSILRAGRLAHLLASFEANRMQTCSL